MHICLTVYLWPWVRSRGKRSGVCCTTIKNAASGFCISESLAVLGRVSGPALAFYPARGLFTSEGRKSGRSTDELLQLLHRSDVVKRKRSWKALQVKCKRKLSRKSSSWPSSSQKIEIKKTNRLHTKPLCKNYSKLSILSHRSLKFIHT